jgi:hypothetical protein
LACFFLDKTDLFNTILDMDQDPEGALIFVCERLTQVAARRGVLKRFRSSREKLLFFAPAALTGAQDFPEVAERPSGPC